MEYEKEIQLLRQEIAELRAQQENGVRAIAVDHGDFIQHAFETIASRQEREGSKKDSVSKMLSEIKDIQEDLRKQANINGISLRECYVKTLEKSESKTVQQHRLTGKCSYLVFQVEFSLVEVQEDGALLRRVTDLNIVMDGSEFKDFSKFVSGVEESNSLLLFFRTLRDFSEKCDHRSRTYQHFKKCEVEFVEKVELFDIIVYVQNKYPDVVSLPEGCRSEMMTIQNPRLPGCAINVYWSIGVSKEGLVTPKVDLLLKMPNQALEKNTGNIIENGPTSFQSLLRLLGVEASLESLIKTVSV